jgi:hypothetical protein
VETCPNNLNFNLLNAASNLNLLGQSQARVEFIVGARSKDNILLNDYILIYIRQRCLQGYWHNAAAKVDSDSDSEAIHEHPMSRAVPN